MSPTFFVAGWSGATPYRTRPPATGSLSTSVTAALVCSSRSSAAYMPAGPVPTTATRIGAKSDGRLRSKAGSPQEWKFGPSSAGRGSSSSKYSALIRAYSFCAAGRLSTGKIASTGQASAHAPQSMHDFGSMYSISVLPKARSCGVGWMQLTGHTATQVASPQQVWVMAKVMSSARFGSDSARIRLCRSRLGRRGQIRLARL